MSGRRSLIARGAPANTVGEHVYPEVQEDRYARFMTRASEISAQRLARKVGTHMRVLVDAVEEGVATARSEGDAPEIDGLVHIEGASSLAPGDWADVEITASDAYDLTAKLVA